MTTIAWDGQYLAGDRKRTIRNTPMEATKIFRTTDRCLYGTSGGSAECEAFRAWQCGSGEKPSLTYFIAICVKPDRSVWEMEENGLWLRISRKQWAIGSGADYALGAMAAGATAREAVEIASRLDSGTGMGVDILGLE